MSESTNEPIENNNLTNDTNQIVRHYPCFVPLFTNTLVIIPPYMIDIFKTKMRDKNFRKDFEKWKKCINPYTNKRMKKHSAKYNEIGQMFKINEGIDLEAECFIDFKYIEKVLYGGIEEYYYNLLLQNKKIEQHMLERYRKNLLVYNVITKINSLNNWNDYIEFDGVKYGFVDKVKDDKHIENNCFGDMKYIKDYNIDCDFCLLNNVNCNHYPHKTYKLYVCEKCNYEHNTQYDRYEKEPFKLIPRCAL